MFGEDRLEGLEYLPEPEDVRILSAVDSSVVSHDNEWRSNVMGHSPNIVRPVMRTRRRITPFGTIITIAFIGLLLVFAYRMDLLFVELPPPTSEWAFEQTGVRDFQDEGYTGEGVRICLVDTGVSVEHDSLSGMSLVWKDFVSNSDTPKDYGGNPHGTMMVGILASSGHQIGVTPNATIGMAASLSSNSDGENVGDSRVVARAIDWCRTDFQAHIISLSLGGKEDFTAREGATVSAVRQAIDSGIFVVSAAGNDGGPDDDGDVASPAHLEDVITVGALTRDIVKWDNTSVGSLSDSDGENRSWPNQKPEVSAPGFQIVSTGTENNWYLYSGTSDATVFVSGALALIIEANPFLMQNGVSPDIDCLMDLKNALANSSMAIDSNNHSPYTGYGSLNVVEWNKEFRLTQTCYVA